MILKRRNKMNRVQHGMVNGENNPTQPPSTCFNFPPRELFRPFSARSREPAKRFFSHGGSLT